MTRRLYKTSDVAELLSVSLTKAKELVATGQIPSVKIDRSRRVTGDALDAYIARLERDQLGKAS